MVLSYLLDQFTFSLHSLMMKAYVKGQQGQNVLKTNYLSKAVTDVFQVPFHLIP